MTDREIGIFPPTDEWDVAAYPTDDVVDGYHSHSLEDCEPGNNQTAGFRWGWTNARRDMSHVPDGYEHIRYAYIRMSRLVN